MFDVRPGRRNDTIMSNSPSCFLKTKDPTSHLLDLLTVFRVHSVGKPSCLEILYTSGFENFISAELLKSGTLKGCLTGNISVDH